MELACHIPNQHSINCEIGTPPLRSTTSKCYPFYLHQFPKVAKDVLETNLLVEGL